MTYPWAVRRVGDLCEVDLIAPLCIAQSVFTAIWLLVNLVGGQLLQLLHRPIPVCFEVDAYAAIHWTHGHVQVNVCNARLDDFVQHFVGLLVICYSHSHVSVAIAKTGSHASWEMAMHFLRQLKKAIPLSSVLVYHGNSAGVGIPRAALYHDAV